MPQLELFTFDLTIDVSTIVYAQAQGNVAKASVRDAPSSYPQDLLPHTIIVDDANHLASSKAVRLPLHNNTDFYSDIFPTNLKQVIESNTQNSCIHDLDPVLRTWSSWPSQNRRLRLESVPEYVSTCGF